MSRESHKAKERAKKVASMSREDAEAYLDAEKTGAPEKGGADSLQPDCCASWGLWHSGKDRWLTHPLSNTPMAFGTKGEAAAAKVRITRGKRDVNSNWLRIAVKIRRFTRHNAAGEPLPPTASADDKKNV